MTGQVDNAVELGSRIDEALEYVDSVFTRIPEDVHTRLWELLTGDDGAWEFSPSGPF